MWKKQNKPPVFAPYPIPDGHEKWPVVSRLDPSKATQLREALWARVIAGSTNREISGIYRAIGFWLKTIRFRRFLLSVAGNVKWKAPGASCNTAMALWQITLLLTAAPI